MEMVACTAQYGEETMSASFSDIDWLIRRSTEGPDNPITILILLFASVYAIAGIVLLCAGLIGMFEKRNKT